MEKTVFILGAGSNVDIGFPLGRTIVENAINDINNTQSELCQLLMRIGEKISLKEDFLKFAKELKYSGLNSIDEFVFQYEKYELIGKIITLFYVIKSENLRDLFNTNEPHWYQFISQRIYSRLYNNFPSKKIAFVTFNYDRSLEHFFYNTILNIYSERNPELNFSDFYDKLPIYHVYGKLHNLKLENDKDYIEYGHYNSQIKLPFSEDDKTFDLLMDLILKSIDKIMLIFDTRRNNNKNLERIRNLIEESSSVIFLGFAFESENMKNLGLINKNINTIRDFEKYSFIHNYNSNRSVRNRVLELEETYSLKVNKSNYKSITDYLGEEIDF